MPECCNIFCLQNCADLLQTRFLEFNDLKVETGSEPLLVKLDPSRQTVQLNLKKRLLVLRRKKNRPTNLLTLQNSMQVFVMVLMHI
jgi:hypothetical protein